MRRHREIDVRDGRLGGEKSHDDPGSWALTAGTDR